MRGHWSGTLQFRGAEWPLRIHFSGTGEKLEARLDLPSLVMTGESIAVEENAGTLRIELPFGVGEFELSPDDQGRLSAENEMSPGELISLRLEKSDAPPYREEEVRFRNGTVDLSGTLVLPSSGGPHPVVVMVHGSGAQGRDNWSYRSWADFFARHGVATLIYDKRGVGESSGDWLEADFDTLAGDALAAVRYLASRDEIDGQRIGLCGGSQGGWISTLAVSRSEEIAFLILRSTPAVTPAEQEFHRIEYGMRKEGLPEDAIQDALAHARLYFYVVRTGTGWKILRDSSRDALETAWGDWAPSTEKKEDLEWWRRVHDFDPRPLLAKISIPTLALYGGADTAVPPLENISRLEQYHGGSQNGKLRIEVFPGGDHRGEVPFGTGEDGRWRFAQMAPGLLEVMEEWLDHHVLSSSSRRQSLNAPVTAPGAQGSVAGASRTSRGSGLAVPSPYVPTPQPLRPRTR